MGPLMLVFGGRTNSVNDKVPLEIYDTESSEWYKFNSSNRFRTAAWTNGLSIYIHGGFSNETPNVPLDSTFKIDVAELLANRPVLLKKTQPKATASKKQKTQTKDI